MAILAFQKPEKVIMLESTSSFGKFEFRPLEPGFGMTVGNALPICPKPKSRKIVSYLSQVKRWTYNNTSNFYSLRQKKN